MLQRLGPDRVLAQEVLMLMHAWMQSCVHKVWREQQQAKPASSRSQIVNLSVGPPQLPESRGEKHLFFLAREICQGFFVKCLAPTFPGN